MNQTGCTDDQAEASFTDHYQFYLGVCFCTKFSVATIALNLLDGVRYHCSLGSHAWTALAQK